MEVIFQLRDKMAAWSRLMQLIFSVVLVAHFIACAWHKIALTKFNNGVHTDDIWIGDDIHKDLQSRYVMSLYWAIITMTTIGYGDISPVNQNERIFVIAIAIVSSVIFGYTMNQIGDILKELSKGQQDLKEQLVNINIYLNNRSVNNTLQMKIRKYLEYLNTEKNQNDERGQILINNSLTVSLKHEVLKDIYGKILRSKKVFKLNFSNIFIETLALKMKEQTLAPEEIIYNKGDMGDKIYFIIKGEVEEFLYLNQDNQKYLKINSIGKDDFFGCFDFFKESRRQISARTINVTSLAYLSLEDFKDAILNFPVDFENFKLIQHNINIMDSRKGLDFQCECCGKYDHNFQTCPYVNKQIYKQQNLQKVVQNNSIKQSRGDSYRSYFREKNSIKNSIKCEKASQQIQFYQELNASNFKQDQNDNLNINVSQQKGKSELSLSSSSSSSINSDNYQFINHDIQSANSDKYKQNNTNKFQQKSSSAHNLNTVILNSQIPIDLIKLKNINLKQSQSLQQKTKNLDNRNKQQIPQLELTTVLVKQKKSPEENDNDSLPQINIQEFKDKDQIIQQNTLQSRQSSNNNLSVKYNRNQQNQNWLDNAKKNAVISQSFLQQINQQCEDNLLQFFRNNSDNNIIEQPKDIMRGFDKMQMFVYFLPRNNYILVINKVNRNLRKSTFYKNFKKNKKNMIKKFNSKKTKIDINKL